MNINHSRISHYLLCKRFYYWRYIHNLVPLKDAMPLLVGRAVHAGLAAHYAEKDAETAEAHARSIFKETKESNTWLGPELEDLSQQEEYVAQILAWYREQWKQEPWTVLAPEVKGDVPLGKHKLFYRTDAIISWKGHPWLLEHKTTSQLGNTFFRKFRNDGQITVYCYAVWKELEQRPVGAVINAIRKSKKLDRADFAREVVPRTEKQINDYADQCRLIADEVESDTETLKAPLLWYMHTDQCVRYNRTCDYLELCTNYRPAALELFTEREADYVDEGDE